MMPSVVSFYTQDWTYPQHAERLRQECDALALDHHIRERPSAGGYLENTCIKPFFIRDMLNELKRPVLWIDVDGSIFRRPVYFDGLTVDFAARMMPKGRRTWHVGTMWFNYTPEMMSFMDRWCENTGGMSDESALEDTWRQGQGITTANIPPDYFVLGVGGQKPQRHTVIYHRISDGESKRAQRPIFSKGQQVRPAESKQGFHRVAPLRKMHR